MNTNAQSLNVNIMKTMDLKVTFPCGKDLSPFLKSIKKNFFTLSEIKTDFVYAILNTNVNHKCDTASIVIQLIQEKTFHKFQIRHEATNYFQIFHPKRCRLKDYFQKKRKVKGQLVNYYTEDKKCEKQVNIAQIREVFQKILYKVVSQELIGNNRNKKKILKTYHNFLLTAKNEYFSLQNLITQLNISSIKWLKVITDEQKKYIIFAKFIKWLFQYFIGLTLYQFHVAYIKEERVFILLKDWKVQKNKFLKKMYDKMAFESISEVNNLRNIKSKLFLVPKQKGIRCITIQKYSNVEKQELRKVISVLKRLYQIHLSDTDKKFSDKFIEFVNNNNLKNKNIYIISSDICNAYDSIKQDKLFNIIKTMFEELPDKLIFEWYVVNKLRKYKFVNCDPIYLKFAIANSNKFEVTKKDEIYSRIVHFIYDTKVMINNKIFNLCKGIAQGLMLSAILCEIYYSHMRKKYFSVFENDGTYFSYVDDSIYLTKSLKNAKEYVSLIKNGIPEYNCWFNKSKLKYNLNNYDRKIEYLGWVIDANSLEIEPKYNSPRHSVTYTSLSSLRCPLKMQNLASLKLNRLILYKKINSKKQIYNNIKLIARHHAKRCFALANYLYQHQYKLSIRNIENVNSRIVHKILSLTEWDKHERSRNYKKLRYIFWKSFYDIFNKKREKFLYLIKSFKKFMKNT